MVSQPVNSTAATTQAPTTAQYLLFSLGPRSYFALLRGGAACSDIRPLLTGSDITQRRSDSYAIDLYGLDVGELRDQYPAIYQWVYDNVKPERDHNPVESQREKWWLFSRTRGTFRPALAGCGRAIATSLTAKHRTFIFVDEQDICDSTTVMFALPDALHFGVMSSRVHIAWALAAGGTLEDRPRYNKSLCFESFPFPDVDTGLTSALADSIRRLGEQIDKHRKMRQAEHDDLTLTAIYNVLEKLRSGAPLTSKEKTVHDHGLIGVLASLHDELDSAVLQAYGCNDLSLPADTDTLLERLVGLNNKRAAEEASGTVRWLRPDFQRSQSQGAQIAIEVGTESSADEPVHGAESAKTRSPVTRPWPAGLTEQIKAVADVLAQAGTGLDYDAVAAHFSGRGRWRDRLPTLLETLAALGRARVSPDGRWTDAGR